MDMQSLLRDATAGILLAAFCIATAAHARADDYVVRQKGKQFDPPKLSIRVGESVRFVNDDRVAHNVYYSHAGDKFNLGIQKPGTEDTATFDDADEVHVRCAIHPRMRLTIAVTE